MKIALIGYGKMGHMIEEIALSRGHEIVSIIDVDNAADIDSDAFRSADVAIEFTSPTAAYGNYLKAWAQGGSKNMRPTSARLVPKGGTRSSGPPTSRSALPFSQPSTNTWRAS